MSRALRLVVTQSKCERLEIPNILQSYLKNHGVYAMVIDKKKSYRVQSRVENAKCPKDMSKVKNQRKRIHLLNSMRMQKSSSAKCSTGVQAVQVGSQDSESKVRKISDQKLT